METLKEKEETTDGRERQNLFHDPLTNQIRLKSPEKKENSLRGILLTLPTFWDDPSVCVSFRVSFKAIYGRRRDLLEAIADSKIFTGNISINTTTGASARTGKSFASHFLTSSLINYGGRKRTFQSSRNSSALLFIASRLQNALQTNCTRNERKFLLTLRDCLWLTARKVLQFLLIAQLHNCSQVRASNNSS